jgi:hypothetical protein
VAGGDADAARNQAAVRFAQRSAGTIGSRSRKLTVQAIVGARGTSELGERLAAFLCQRPARWIPP